jgi:hypothetical protein
MKSEVLPHYRAAMDLVRNYVSARFENSSSDFLPDDDTGCWQSVIQVWHGDVPPQCNMTYDELCDAASRDREEFFDVMHTPGFKILEYLESPASEKFRQVRRWLNDVESDLAHIIYHEDGVRIWRYIYDGEFHNAPRETAFIPWHAADFFVHLDAALDTPPFVGLADE